MATALKALEQSEKVVFQSFTLTRAAIACGQLEASGMPTRLARVSAGYVVFVPNEYAEASSMLLVAQAEDPERQLTGRSSFRA